MNLMNFRMLLYYIFLSFSLMIAAHQLHELKPYVLNMMIMLSRI